MSLVGIATIVREELARTLRRPQRLARLLRPAERRRYVEARRERRFMDGFAAPWEPEDDSALRHRIYASYDEYVRHQRSKLTMMAEWVEAEYDQRFSAALAKRLREAGVVRRGQSVLCLGARIGSEVRTFHELGCFAVGIDLNPGSGSQFVLEGDFHDLQFPAACCDVVFTNSLDHAFDLDRVVAEVARVLKPSGVLVVEADDRPDKGPGPWESLSWRRVDDLVAYLETRSWMVARRTTFDDYPWPGTQLVLISPSFHEPTIESGKIECEVLDLNRFGNVLLNVRESQLSQSGLDGAGEIQVDATSGSGRARRVSTYADVESGDWGLIVDPRGWLQVVRGNPANAAEGLGSVAPGDPIWLTAATDQTGGVG
jgi:SAM-dependent methyltransferase